MKYLLVSGIYPPDIGGPANFVPLLANELVSDGNNVSIITLKNSLLKSRNARWPIFYINRDQNLVFRFIRTIILIIRKSQNLDSVIANGLFQETGIALLFTRVKSIAKVVGDPVWERALNNGETMLNIDEFNKSKLNLKHNLQRRILLWSLNRFTYVTCPSKQLCELVSNWGVKTPIKFIANGVDLIAKNDLKAEFDIVCVSRLIRPKNIDKMILVCKESRTRLAVIGSGPEEKNLKQLANSIKADVTFLGELEQDSVYKILNKSKLFINLSSHEGLSYALLEAMSLGMPCIVSNIRGNTDVITNNLDGIVVDAENLLEVCTVIDNLLKTPTLSNKLGENALKKVRLNYSHYVQMKKIINLTEKPLYR